MLDPDEMNRLIVKALHEPDEEEYTTNQKRVLYEIRECDYIPYLLNYKALILCQPFHSSIGDMLNMIDTQIDYLQSIKLLHVLEEIQLEIESTNKKEHVYGYGCKLHEDDPDIIHWIERGDIMKYDENIIHDGLLNYKDLDETPEEREKRRQEDKKIGEEIRQRKKEQVHERITSTRLKELEYELHQKQKEYEETLEKFRVERVKVLEEENRMLHEKVKILQMKLDKR